MRFSTSDPRVRQTLNQISENLESANQRTQTTIFTFSEAYIQPCLAFLQPCCLSCQNCLEASCQPCCSARDDIRRHRQPRYSRRGRERAAFDFYDDWEEEEEQWGNDELERLLAGDDTYQPGRHAGMSYGTRTGARRTVGGKDGPAHDPTLVPQSSIFGFLERLPWKIGGRGTRYKPSPANLRVNVGKRGQEAEPLLEDEEAEVNSKKRRDSKSTIGSRETANSLSSRGDIFPSDDEDDAREIDDDYALALGRRSTGATSDDAGSKRKVADSRASTKTASSKDLKGAKKNERGETISSDQAPSSMSESEVDKRPSTADLEREEEEARHAEESQITERRTKAQRLAYERGLSNPTSPIEEDSKEASIVANPDGTGGFDPPNNETGSDVCVTEPDHRSKESSVAENNEYDGKPA